MSRIPSLQDPFLNALRKEKVSLFIFLVNGIKLKGTIEAFDQISIILRNSNDHVNQMIYKHSISIISPTKSVRFVYSNYNPNHHTSCVNGQDNKIEKDNQHNKYVASADPSLASPTTLGVSLSKNDEAPVTSTLK